MMMMMMGDWVRLFGSSKCRIPMAWQIPPHLISGSVPVVQREERPDEEEEQHREEDLRGEGELKGRRALPQSCRKVAQRVPEDRHGGKRHLADGVVECGR